MKKFCFFFIALVVAQLSFAQNVQLGLKGGLNISGVKDTRLGDANADPFIGYHVGGLAHIHLNPNWALQPEVVYSKEGADFVYQGVDTRTELKYINIPVLAQYMTAGGFRLETGPQLGLLVDNKYEYSNGVETENVDNKKTNVSWAFGAGYLSRSGLGIDARFNLGLSNIYKDGIYNGAVSKTRVGQIGIFYQFRQ
jgi:hypothetical protein